MMEEILEEEVIDHSDKDDAVKIVLFEKRQHDILIGYRQKNRVVYASVPTDLDDSTAKQKGYEQVRTALAYEQTLDEPSIDGSDMEPIEAFTPAEPIATTIKIDGPSVVTFDVGDVDKIVTYTVSAYDQYDDIVTSQTIEQMFDNTDYTETVSAEIDGVVAELNVTVQAYREPAPPLEEQLAERDKQIAELKTQLTATEQVMTENTLAQQELLELLIDMGVL